MREKESDKESVILIAIMVAIVFVFYVVNLESNLLSSYYHTYGTPIE